MQGTNLRKWDYGRYSRIRLAHPLFANLLFLGSYARIGPVPMSGSASTVKQTTPRLGPSMRMVVDLADLDNSLMTTGDLGVSPPVSPLCLVVMAVLVNDPVAA